MSRSDKIATGPYWRLLGIRAGEVQAGKSVVQVEVDDRLVNYLGNMHGGATASLIDCAIGIAAHAELPPDLVASTVNLNVHYLRAVQRGMLTAVASTVHRGRTLLVARCEVVDAGDRLVAFATATMAIRDLGNDRTNSREEGCHAGQVLR